MKRLATFLLLSLLLFSLVAIGGYGWLDHQWHQELVLPKEGATLSVRPGDSLQKVLSRTETEGWLQHPRWVGFMASQRGLDERLHVGEYRLVPGTTACQLMVHLASGDVVRHQVTLPEGIRLSEALGILCAQPELACTLDGVDDPQLLSLVSPSSSAEGWFMPETYSYVSGDSDFDVLRQASQLLKSALTELWSERDTGLPLSGPTEALILASIIEKETGGAAERGEIAGVFTRRLIKGMRLETDPTVIYGLGEGFDGNLKRSHLKDETNPYNTYKIKGLPPTPIALAGRAAIAAAVHPAAGESLYFVAKGDGSHVFADSLADHEANVRQYQLNRRKDYRSSPQ